MESLSLSFGLQALRLFQAYAGPLKGIGPTLSSPLSHKVTSLGRTNVSATRIKKKKLRDHLSLSFLEKYIFGTSLIPVDPSSIFGRTIRRLSYYRLAQIPLGLTLYCAGRKPQKFFRLSYSLLHVLCAHIIWFLSHIIYGT